MNGGNLFTQKHYFAARIPSFRHQLTLFIRRSKLLIRTFGDNAAANVIRSSTQNHHRLGHYGINQKLPCLQATLCMSPCKGKLMHDFLCTIRGSHEMETCRRLRRRTAPQTLILVGPLVFRKFAPWRTLVNSSYLKDASIRHLEATRYESMHCGQNIGIVPRPTRFDICCPRCDRIKSVAKITLYNRHKWRQIKCCNCCRIMSASKWLCECGLKWHECPKHRSPGFQCRSAERRTKPAASIHLLADSRLFKRTRHLAPLGQVSAKDELIQKHSMNNRFRSSDLPRASSTTRLEKNEHHVSRQLVEAVAKSKYAQLHVLSMHAERKAVATVGATTPSTAAHNSAPRKAEVACTALGSALSDNPDNSHKRRRIDRSRFRFGDGSVGTKKHIMHTS